MNECCMVGLLQAQKDIQNLYLQVSRALMYVQALSFHTRPGICGILLVERLS